MRNYMVHSFVILIVFALATVTAFADKIKKAQLTLSTDVMVSGTLVKAGKYDFRFDEKTGELAILKNGNVKAKANARLEQRNEKAKYTAIITRQTGEVSELTGLKFGGSNEEVVLTSAAASR